MARGAPAGRRGQAPKLPLQTGAAPAACGSAQTVRIDRAFCQDLHPRFRTPGDFARACVLAREIGRRVQRPPGIPGDDRIRERAHGGAVPDSFTHDTSAQRGRWFSHGAASGALRQCDPVVARPL